MNAMLSEYGAQTKTRVGLYGSASHCIFAEDIIGLSV